MTPTRQHRLPLGLSLLLLLGACGPTPVTFTCLEDDPLCSLEEALEELPPAVSVDIQSVAFYQSTEKVLYLDGEAADDPVSVAQGRPALLRVFLSPQDTYQEREIAVRAYVFQDDALVDAVIVRKKFSSAGSWSDLDSTFNLEIRGSAIGPETEIAIEVLESTLEADYPGIQGENLWPETGTFSLETQRTGILRVLMVPLQYDADGSGRLPNTSDEEMERFRQAFYGQYPVTEVEIQVSEPLSTTIGIRNGWSALLSELTGQRAALGAEADQYVYGLFDPGGDSTGGTAGLCWVGFSAGDPGTKVCIGLTGSPSTAVHEVGHAHGREHSPGCGAGSPDPNYPEEDGTLGKRAWDVTGNRLLEAETSFDFMSYCAPTWTGAYTWEALTTRVTDVNALAGAYMESREYQVLFQDDSGALSMVQSQWLPGTPGGEPVTVFVIDAAGQVVAQAPGRRVSMDHSLGGAVRLLEPLELAEGERLRLGGF